MTPEQWIILALVISNALQAWFCFSERKAKRDEAEFMSSKLTSAANNAAKDNDQRWRYLLKHVANINDIDNNNTNV